MPAIRRVNPDPLIYERQGDTSVLRPQAAPVETFVRPAEPQKSGATDLAEALVGIRPTINKFLVDKADDIAYEDSREAESKAMMSTAKTWDEAIAKGEVSAGASPLYRRVYEETLGKLHGMNEAQAKLWQEWVSPDNTIRNTQDPAEIGKWFASKRQGLLEGKSVDFQKGMAPMLAQVQQQLTQRIIADNIKAIEQGNHDALGQLFMDRILAGKAAGQSPAQIAAQLADDAVPQRFAGMQGKEINQIAAKAIIGAAQRLKDPNILQVGYSDRPDIRNPGQTIRGVFSIPDFGNAAESARTAILQHQNVQEARADRAQALNDKKVAQKTLGDFVQKKIDDPNWEPSPDELKAAVKAMPDFMTHWRAQERAIKEPKQTPNLHAFNALLPRFFDAVNQGRDDVEPLLTRMIDTGALSSAQIIALRKQADKTENSEDNIVKSQAMRIGMNTLQQAGADPLGRKLDPIKSALEVGIAQGELYRFATDWQMKARTQGRFDADAFSKAVEAKVIELTGSLGTKLVPTTPPDKGAAPGADGQKQGAAPAPLPLTDNSLAGNIQLAPIAAEAASARWPQPPKGQQWSPPAGVQIDLAEVNALRSSPLVKNQEGKALWQRFEEKYGPGSVSFFMSPNQNTILQRLQKPGGSPK